MAPKKRYFKEETDEKPSLKKLKSIKKSKGTKKPKSTKKPSKVKTEPVYHQVKLEETISVDPEQLKKYSRGVYGRLEGKGVKTKYFKHLIKEKGNEFKLAAAYAAQAEELNNEEDGFLITDADESTLHVRQSDIVANVDITAQKKSFNLNLDQFGPYRHKYTKNGRYLLLGGKKGHVSLIDFVSKRLHCEMNVMEEVADIEPLHVENMFAVAGKRWVQIYDSKGIQLHTIQRMERVNRLEFLPYHFLLVGGSDLGYLTWLDTSIGEIVSNYHSKNDCIRIMAQHYTTGAICIGNAKGVVKFYSPAIRDPLLQISCHGTAINALSVAPTSGDFVTAGIDKNIKLWDIRMTKQPKLRLRLSDIAGELTVSQKGLIAIGMDRKVEIYRRVGINSAPLAYLQHRVGDTITGMSFCPFEDVLGISTGSGFNSILVPGAGEPNFDAYEANPFQTKSQRREREVQNLLEKIPMELITLDPDAILKVQKTEDETNSTLVPPKVEFKPANKKKGKSKVVRKEIVREAKMREFKKVAKVQNAKEDFISLKSKSYNVLDRFKQKTTKKSTTSSLKQKFGL